MMTEPQTLSADHWKLATEAAALLVPAWQSGQELHNGLPEALRPTSEQQAYAIQQAVTDKLGRIGGWKVGAASPALDAHFTCAPMPLAGIHHHPARLPSAQFTLRAVEAEICLRIGRDLPVRAAPYGADEVLAAIESCHSAIEVLQSRYGDPDRQDRLSVLADSISHGGFVVGPPIADWSRIDWPAEAVTLRVDGTEEARRTGNPGGEMPRMLVWLANIGARWAGGLKIGQYVTTGSWTGKTPVGASGAVDVQFTHADAVALRFF